ncbi:MAG TPA: division/cell wall cluster transcriptional repressor MraZ [Chloroflexota bacterium]|nr:division/cell wall cluster transcriptional repressor MraZ [Chloroflexota bacterium]HZU04457.1 division/cell wall cluster transcriptional repressor MraZ [Chloroflexota bacterium]
MFLGEFEHSLDEKGRLAIPARFRGELGQGLVITRGLDRCLFVWPMSEWRTVAEKLGRLSLMHAEARRLQRLLFAGAVDTQLDRLGRVLIPGFLRSYAGLRDAVIVAGVLTRIEIWDREQWLAERSAAEEQSAELAEHLSALGL